MNTTQALIARLKEARGLRSDYAVAKHLGVTTPTLTNWKYGRTQMDNTTALQVADELGLDPLAIMAKLKLERPHTPRDRQVWGRYEPRLLLAALAAVASLTLLQQPAALASSHYVNGQAIHYANLRRLLGILTGGAGGAWWSRPRGA